MAEQTTGQNAPRVSVIIPCYGQAHLLPEAVRSVADQTFANQDHAGLECVIVDDGSPDNTAAVAMRLIDEHPHLRLRLVRQENRGLAEARNTGIRSCRAELILPLDSDDKLAPTAVEKMVTAFDADPDVAIVGTWGREFGDRTNFLHTASLGLRRLLKGNTLLCASMFPRATYQRTQGYNANMTGGFEDWDFWISILEQGGRAHVIEEELFFYRKSGKSMIDAADARDLWLRARIVLNHPALFERGRVRLAQQTVGVANPENPGISVRLRWIAYFLKDLNRSQFTRQVAALVNRTRSWT